MASADRTQRGAGTAEPAPVPSLSLPKGGGAIQGIGEKFAANPANGTGSTSIPLATSRGRSDVGPALSLSYDSGSGNGPFGFGWTLSLPAITRQTARGLPQYDDGGESDVFVLSGAEDLVPVLGPTGQISDDGSTVSAYRIRRYRPRIEGLFSRIERWTRKSDGDIHWRIISKDNVLSIYGSTSNSRIADPGDPRRVFSWLLCETRNDKGNGILYEYKAEDGAGVPLGNAHERNRGARGAPQRAANRYVKRIRYGNRASLLDAQGRRPRFLTDAQAAGAGWMFEAVFDYGEHDAESPRPGDTGAWSYRADSFSSYRAGFEVRTCRLCQRVLMFHHFENEPGVGRDCLVRSTDLTYSYEQNPADARNPVYSFLLAVTQCGYRRTGGGYVKRSLPPVEFGYSRPDVQAQVHEVDAESLENLPIGLDGAVYQWTDLHGEGIPGILTELAGAWFYKRNLSPANVTETGGTGSTRAKFGPVELVAVKPSFNAAEARARFMDLAGDGQPDLAVLSGPMPGLYEHDEAESWKPFRAFTSRLNRDTGDPNVRFVDLDGDGRADVLVTEEDALVWHPSLGEEGFGPARRVPQDLDEETGPRLVFADGTESVHLADMNGDGLADLVRIRNGEVCYWPSLGFARFGAKIAMDRAPQFDHPHQFDPKRLRLADVDGSGTTDLVYLHPAGIRLYFNQSGNGWSAAQILPVSPPVDDLTAITPTDLLGNGTACLVWSSPLAGDARRQMRYVDLMSGRKPHLLVSVRNNLGAETRIHYAPSTKFFLQDKRNGRPWITRLPFPVHAVERIETHDRVSGNRFVSRYAYHHGYFDGHEREFRGFGMVEQWDTEEFARLTTGGAAPGATNLDAASHVPPVHTKTWFHTGVHVGRGHVSDFFAGLLDAGDRGEYYREPGLTDAQANALLLPDTPLPGGLTVEEEREACRALRGAMLRQEVYALDGTGTADYPSGQPYSVTEQNFTVALVQPKGNNRHAVVFQHPRETLGYRYERNPADPRVTHHLTLEVDRYGNVLRDATIGYGRRQSALAEPRDRDAQSTPRITYTENRVTNVVDTAGQASDDFRTPLVAEIRTSELTGIRPAGNASRFAFGEWTSGGFALPASAAVIPYEQQGDGVSRQKRVIEHVRALFRRDDLTSTLPLGAMESKGLLAQSYRLALTPGIVSRVFTRRVAGQPDEDLLPGAAPLLQGKGADQGGYVSMDGGWWVPSTRAFLDPGVSPGNPAQTAATELNTARQHFYLPRKFVDAFDQSTLVDYDAHDLLVARSTDAVGNRVEAANDYRVLQPRLVTDANRNRAAAAFDALGWVVATAVMGKAGETLGDLLEGFEADPTLADLQAFAADPHARAGPMLGRATTRIVYDEDRFRRCGQPPFIAMLARETHVSDVPGAAGPIQIGFSYSDGFGREIQRKTQAEPGSAPRRGANVTLASGDSAPGDLVRDAAGALVRGNLTRRWVGTGRTVFNNKGRPVRQYEPFFSATHLYEPERDMTDTGVSAVLCYDPVERVAATLFPNHTYEKVVIEAWKQTRYDVNDTVLLDPRSDGDVKAFFVRPDGTARMPASDYLPTWHALRTDAAHAAEAAQRWPDQRLRIAERDAAIAAAAHADTPTVVHLDTLGREFLTLADNGPDAAQPGQHMRFATRVELDVESNTRAVRDAIVQVGDRLGRVVMIYDHDMLGNRIHQSSMEAGERWMLNDAAGKPIRVWDSRRLQRRVTYDALRRQTGLFITEAGTERLAERTVYGEGLGDARNHRTRPYQVFDGAGLMTRLGYDFKGNLLETRRELLSAYRQAVDWQQTPALAGGTFTTATTYDALNRARSVRSPDGSIHHPSFNEANLLDKVAVNLRGASAATPFVTGIDYDARGQRERIAYGNGAVTSYEYDPLTFRLVRMKTTRPSAPATSPSSILADPAVVQDLRYTYDPAGNATRIEDAALKPVFHGGQQVDPVALYRYDATYRLVEAQGREHIGQTAFDFTPGGGNHRDQPFVGYDAHPNDLQALRSYTERYDYDGVGNLLTLRHIASGGSWTRSYECGEASLLEAGKRSNRLTKTTLGNGLNRVESCTYDVHGNTTAMPHLAALHWDFRNQLRRVDLGGGGTAWYVYDADGRRVRKVVESQSASPLYERTYIGGLEIHQEFAPGSGAVKSRRESLHVMDDRHRIALIETPTIDNGSPVGAPAPLQRYQLVSHLESACVELAGDGSLVSYEDYHPYGTTAFQAGRSAAELSLKRYRYSGKERDEETGFQYFGARYYAPWLGRWVSPDPAELIDGPNSYAAFNGRPSVAIDRDGTSADDDRPSRLDVKQAKAARAAQEQIAELEKRSDEVRAAMQKVENLQEGLIDALRRMTNEDSGVPDEAEAKLAKDYQRQVKKQEAALEKAMKKWAQQLKKTEKAVKRMPLGPGELETGQLAEGAKRLQRESKDTQERIKERNRQVQKLDEEVTRRGKKPPGGGGAPGSGSPGGGPHGPGGGPAGPPKGGGFSAFLERTAETLASSKTGKVVAAVTPILAKGVVKAVPVVGIGAGAYGVASEFGQGNVRRGALEAIGTSEIPIVSQAADIGLAVEDAGWAAKDIIDPEQKSEEWFYRTFLD